MICILAVLEPVYFCSSYILCVTALDRRQVGYWRLLWRCLRFILWRS